jgi:protein-S-isoprenylcysteine O-methyltransferase Ste14
MVTMILAYVLILPFFAMELFQRKDPFAKSITRGRFDQGSTILILLSFISVVILAPLLNFTRTGDFTRLSWIGWIGITMMLLGTALRYWSMRTLGAHYTRTLKVAHQQELVETGAYHLIRHPGYLGTLLIWIGAGLAMMNWITILVVTILMLAAYIYRIRREEAMLLELFRDTYKRYSQVTWHLIPFIW